jgi:glycosyltransferase involved in cell wall biosynthesis
MARNKICCIFNYAPHYRAPIYELMDKELGCDFYFGDTVGTPIKEMDVLKLKGFKKTLKRKTVSRFNYFWLSGGLKPMFLPYKFYIISGGSKYLSSWLLLIISKFSSKKIYSWGHGIKGNKSKFQTFLDKLFYSLCDKTLLYGNFSKNKMIFKGIKENKLEIIYNSLDYSSQLNFREKHFNTSIYLDYFKNDFPVIIYIGRIQKNKNLEMLVEVAEKFIINGKKINLVFVGKDLGDNMLKENVKNRKIEKNTWFVGPCYDESKISELLSNAKICVSPGPIGLTAIHVASYGLPIITNNDFKNQMPEFEIIKDGINGSFFELNNIDSLFEKINFWLETDQLTIQKSKKESYYQIDRFYNPFYQIELLKKLTK